MTRRTALRLASLGTAAAGAFGATAPHTLPKLPYACDALEPYIDAQTMQIHHDKHHQAYVDNLNRAVAADPALARLSVEELLRKLDTLPAGVRTAIRNHGGGHANHTLFWQILTPASSSGRPRGRLAEAINQSFGNQERLEAALKAAAMAVFGSGWAWLTLDTDGKLALSSSPNQDSPLSSGRQPLLGIDVWEHAYYLRYQNRRADYLTAITRVLHWEQISARYEALTK